MFMNRLVGSLALIILIAASSLPALAEDRPTRSICILTPNGWMLDIFSDGSGKLQFGAGAEDGWPFKAGTIDVKRATEDLRALANDDKGRLGSHFIYSFESERRAADRPGKARYTRDRKVIPGLLQMATDAAESHGESHAKRKAEILSKNPLGAIPTE